MLDRRQIIRVFTKTLQSSPAVLACWEAGSAAFGRHDQWSDIDLYLVVADDQVEPVMNKIEEIVANLGGYDLKFRLPEPTWHGNSQVFYRFKNSNPFLFLDAAVIKESSPEKFLQFAIHGRPIVYFDKQGVVQDKPIEVDTFIDRLKKRVETMKTTFELFQVLTLKELNRQKETIALPFYFSMTLRPLVEALRIKHAPLHYNFFTAYLDHDLPPDVYQRLQKFFFVADGLELIRRHAEAGAWFWETIASIDFDEIREKLSADNL